MDMIGQRELAMKDTEHVGHEIKVSEYIGHEIKENTELAEHDIGVQNIKKSTKTVYNKMKEAL